MDNKQARLGADIGGTFTDVVLEVGERRFSTKVLTNYAAPEQAIIEGMLAVCRSADIQSSEIAQVIHGTTLATNALIERNGAKTAFITTKGFRDVIEMRTESRFEQYDLNLALPDPLLPRHQRFTLSERLSANGDVLVPLERAEVERLADHLAELKFESVAVGFLHAYLDARHEEIVLDVLAQKLPGVMVSLSSRVSPQMREYERFNTVVANAYIQPLMKSYLDRLQYRFAEHGVTCPIFLMHSGGGIISLESAAEFPVRLVESGPAGGAVFAAETAAKYGLEKVVSFDMGGTTAKICLIKDFTPKTSRVFEVARSYRFKKGSGMPISIPVIDMVEIGAGGGSLAHVDGMNQIRVGPESAGSEPGPSCYAQGGTRPAVTDADLILGKLDPHNFAGGAITLDPERSRQALEEHIGRELNLEDVGAAFGVAEVVDENMANAARMHAVENGEDLSEYTMIAFGGAAPLHAARLCQKLAIRRVLIPQGAGVGSAIGFLRAPFSFEANRSVFTKLEDFDVEATKLLLEELRQEAVGFVQTCEPKAEVLAEYKVYMRYAGQGWDVPVQISEQDAQAPTPETFKFRFEQAYAALFGRTVEGIGMEITVWSVNAMTPAEQPTPVETQNHAGYISKNEVIREVFDALSQSFIEADVIQRSHLNAGDSVTGPAIIVEDETSVLLPPACELYAQSDGTLDIRFTEGAV